MLSEIERSVEHNVLKGINDSGEDLHTHHKNLDKQSDEATYHDQKQFNREFRLKRKVTVILRDDGQCSNNDAPYGGGYPYHFNDPFLRGSPHFEYNSYQSD